MTKLMVTSEGLNFRSSPSSTKRDNIISPLPRGHPLEKISDAAVEGWIAVRTIISGETLQGFVYGNHTGAVAASGPTILPLQGGKLPPADRGKNRNATRVSASAGMRTFALGEPGSPSPPSKHSDGRAAGIVNIINWLDCGRTTHARWWPAGGQTFCNIYTYDVCTFAGAYLPRVWWNDRALQQLHADQPIEVAIPATVRELNANSLYEWLEEHGADFGWTRHFHPGDVQEAANSGRVAIISAQRINLNRSGHINVVVPEHGQNRASRAGSMVTRPLQSNAGTDNYTVGVRANAWWRSANFRAFGFWSAMTS